MSLSTVTLQWDLTDLIEAGLSATLSITPTAQMSDTTDHILIPPVARAYTFTGGAGSLAGIIANDSANILPAYDPPSSPGAGYLISVTSAGGQVIVPQFQTQILHASGATQWLDELVTVPVVAAGYQYLPLPSGTPVAGDVAVAVANGSTATAWGSPGGGAVSSVFSRTGAVTAQSGDYSSFYDAAGAASTAQSNAQAASLPRSGGTPTGELSPAVVTLAQSGGLVAVNAALGNALNLTIGGSWTISSPTNPTDGQVIRFRLTSGGNYTTSWGTAYDFGAGGSAPVLSITSAKVDIVAFEYVAGISKWCCLGTGLAY
jgi:hypothetical protein